MAKKRRPIRVGRTCVKDALGFFWGDRHKIYIAATPQDIDEFSSRGPDYKSLYLMEDLEQTFRESGALRFISWCSSKKSGCIVRQGARQVTFDYGDDKVVIHIG
jgi:hypothetical protein